MAELFPLTWYTPKMREIIVEYLRWLPVDPEERKRLLLHWAAWSGVTVTAELVSQVTGEPAGKI